jgi:alanyl-tRNA synthetase
MSSIVDLRARFLKFFAARGYTQVPAASLVPENDPSVLFTTAGMQQFKPYYQEPTTAPAPLAASVQPVIRTSDISEVGDDTHLTMFEMLGNFRFGETDIRRMKEAAIREAWQFVRDELAVEPSRVHATIFAGDTAVPRDADSEAVWRSLGVRVKEFGREDNFWGPTGLEGPCGPTTEIYIDGVEVWNLVFNQFEKRITSKDNEALEEGEFVPLSSPGLDTGSGLERLAATLQGKQSVWQIEPFASWVNYTDPENATDSRIIIDHLRAIIFLLSAGITPANKGRDYVLRRLIRAAVFRARKLNKGFDWPMAIAHIREFYAAQYPLYSSEEIWAAVQKEKETFEKNLTRALAHLDQWVQAQTTKPDEKEVTKFAFYMFESFGFPKELLLEHLVDLGWYFDQKYFAELFTAHQEVSRAGLDKQFKGGLADHNEQTIKHHTAHHLLLAALRQVLGQGVVQKGSNVTSERLRLDFSFDRKLTDDELKQVADLVNQKIQEDLPVTVQTLPRDEALASGALAEFGQKYGDQVTVYTIGDFSKELCGGPHIEKTGQLGRFEILKEEASSQGVRRIKARVG